MNLVAIAWRNIGRNKRRSLLSALAMSSSCVFLIVFMAWQKGSYQDMINNTVHAHSGHIQVQQEGYLKDNDLSYRLERPEMVMAELADVPHVEGYAPRVNAPALVGKGTRSFGALIWGIQPESEAIVSTLSNVVCEGEYLRDDDVEGIVLSQLLARNLEAGIGDEVIVLGQGADGSLAAGKLTVRGLFKFGITKMDRAIAVAHISAIQEMFTMGEGVSEVAILLDKDASREETMEVIKAKLAAKGFEGPVVLGWPELLPWVEQTIKMDWNSALIMYGILVLVVGFGIANTFLMAFMERIHEYGVLLSVGMKPRAVSLMAYVESLLLIVVGLIGGVAVGVPIAMYFVVHGITFSGAEEIYAEYGMNPVIRAHLTAEVIGWALGIVALISSVLAIYPAVKAGRLKPVEALRRA